MDIEQIERELSKLYLELNQKPYKEGIELYKRITELEQQLKGLRND